MKDTERRRRPKAGFTLVEILVVICVITVLIGLTANATFSARQKAYKATATQECEQIASAFKAYWLAKQNWPASASSWTDLDKQNMAKLLGKDDDGIVYLSLDENKFESDGTYVDPWGNPYQVMIDPKRDIVLEEVFEAVVSFPNQFSSYFDASAPYMQ